MLTARNITKTLGGNCILRGVDVSVAPGQITAVIGPSGSGKSTLLRALSLLDPPDSGTVTIDETTYDFPLREGEPFTPPWPKLTVVFQQLFLWPHLTVRQNIALPVRNTGDPEQGRLVDELIELFQIGDFADRYPNEVSLGQRQRGAIARALALKPKYLLLDEITSALDIEYVAAMLNHLKRLRDQGTSILVITHYIGFARRSADRVMFVEKGQVLEEGSPEVLSTPKTDRLARFLSLVDAAS